MSDETIKEAYNRISQQMLFPYTWGPPGQVNVATFDDFLATWKTLKPKQKKRKVKRAKATS